MFGKKKESDDKEGGFGNFWQKYILRKKKEDGGKSESEKPLTSTEKNQLAADVASSSLGLDKKAREQVAKAIAAEMQRRHEERERRRMELMSSTVVQLPWGPKPAVKSEKEAPKSQGRWGDEAYPIKMEMIAGKGGKKSATGATPEANTWDDSAWRPVAATGPIGPSIEDRRREWIAKSLKNAGLQQPKVAAAPAAGGPAPAPGSKSPSAAVPESVEFGAQPQAIQMDEAAVKEIHAHTLGMMLQNLLVEASQKQKAKKPTKSPDNMTPEELVEMRRQDPSAWDNHTRQNTVISFGLTTPTDEDVDQGKKTKAKTQKRQVQFDSEIDIAKAPVGRDFNFNEKLTRSTGVLKK